MTGGIQPFVGPPLGPENTNGSGALRVLTECSGNS